MPMIACADCNKEMSDAAPACPGCGRPNARAAAPERSVGLLLGIGILVIPLIFSWFTLRKGHTTKAKVISFAWLGFCFFAIGSQEAAKNSTATAPVNAATPSASSAPAHQTTQAMQVDIRQLLSDYKNNEVGADNKYKDNHVQVTGIVGDIKKDILGDLYVTLGTGAQYEIPTVQAFFDDSMNSQLGNLSKGQKLTVVCRIGGLMMNVLGKDCTIQ